MKAIVYANYGSPDVLQVVEIKKPEIQEAHVLIKVGASGVNPVDTYIRSGTRPVPSFPHIPHFDVAGTIVEVGEGVSRWNVGDRVWGTNIAGTAAEYVSAKEDIVFPLAKHLSFEEGAALAMAFVTAHLSLFYRGMLQPNETVLIFGGAGSVGNAAIQLAKAKGAFVITTASTHEKALIAKNAGADEVIIYTKENIITRVNELTSGKGVPLIIDMSLSDNIEKDLEMISIGGRIVTVGSPNNNLPILPWRLFNKKNATLLGILLLTAPDEELCIAGVEISNFFTEKKLNVHLAKTFPFPKANEAHAAVESKKFSGSIVIVP